MQSLVTECIILAGGLGSRLRPAVSNVPKPMAPVGGRPFLEYIFDYWIGQGIKRFVLSVGYQADSIKQYFGGIYKNCEVVYIFESVPLGTGGAIKQALKLCRWFGNHSLLINGDTWYPLNLSTFVNQHFMNNRPISLALKQMDSNQRYGAVELNDQSEIVKFNVDVTGPCYVNGGCYLLDISYFQDTLKNYPEIFSFEKDLLIALANKNMILGCVHDVTFIDIGIPSDYSRIEMVINNEISN